MIDSQECGFSLDLLLGYTQEAQAKAHLLECHSVTKEEEAMVDSFLEPITLTLASDDAGFESSVQFSFESDDPSAPDSLMTEKLELKLDTDGPSYECPNCNMAFESLDALDEHKREPDQCRIKCRYCDLMFWSRKERVKHHRVHKENANVSCDSCGKFFISAKGLAIHRRRGGCMEERFSCPICHMEFPTVVSRKNHYSTHTRCPECGVENVKNMIDHFRTVHLRQFTCDHCGRTFKTKLIFEQHLARVHKLNGVTERTYQCSGCGKVFTDYSNMKAHFRQFHSSDKNFECQLCGKRTGSQSLLRKHHERVHLHVAKYRCTCCPKVFVYPSQLKKHSRFHTGEMNFPCKYCSKLFRSWENRHEHMLNHLGLQLFRCQICNAQFRRRPLVEKHLSQQHPHMGIIGPRIVPKAPAAKRPPPPSQWVGAKDPVTMNLPHQWLWDIIDEFIYQFHSWSRYQCNLSKKSDEELSILRSDRKVWNVHSVINVLHSLVDKSNINQQLR
ncbi:unnamed protein product, partial [Cyprideis torosa]